MKQTKEDLINKVETLIEEIVRLSKNCLDRNYYQVLTDEATEWVEELRNNEVEFI